MSRRILHIIDSLLRSSAGSQLLVLAQGLSSAGLDVHVAALDGRGAMVADFAAAGVPIVEFNRRWRLDPIAFARLRRHITRLRPDLIHTWGGGAPAYAHLAAPASNAPKLIVGQYRVDPWRAGSRALLEQRVLQRADQVVTDSVHLREWCANNGAAADRLNVIRPGVPPAPASDVSRDGLLHELGLPPNALLIGVVGRLVPEKRVKDLIWAADLLRVLHDNLRLLVIGDGPLRSELERYARLASDLDHIQFLGERADVWRIMPHLDVLWNASEPRGHSLPILEAMAAGVPVVASDTPLNRELVVDDETGYLISLLDRSGRAARARHTDRIFTDRELADQLATASRQRAAENYSAEQMVRQYRDLYVRVAN